MKIQPENANMTAGKTLIAEHKPAVPPQSLVEEGIKQAPAQAQGIKDMLKDALAASGFSTSKENIKLAMMLMEKNLPVNKETLTLIKQAMVLFGSENEAKALLLVLNAIKPTEAAANMLNSYISGDVSLLGNIENIASLISEIDDPKLKAELLKAVLGQQIPEAVKMPGAQIQVPAEATNLPAPEVNANIEATRQMLANSPAIQTLLGEMSKELTSAILESKGVITEAAAQNIEKAIGQIINKLPAELTDSINIKEAAKNILQEIRAGHSPEELVKLITSPPETAGGKAPLHNIIEGELAKMLFTAENKAILTDAAAMGTTATLTRAASSAAIAKALSYDPTNTTTKDLNNYLNNLRDRFELIRQILSNAPPTESNQRLFREAVTLHENLNFFTHMKNNMYLQLPLHINGHFTNAELYIMKDRRARKQKDGSSHSALIAIDTGSLGRFEAYVQKDTRTVNIQFRIETEFVEILVKENIHKLIAALEQHGYHLDGCLYKRLTEAFTLEDAVKNSEIFVPIDFDNAVSFDIRG